MIQENLRGPLFTEHRWKHLGIVFLREGEVWAAVYTDFQTIRDSPAGFGITQKQAVQELLKQKQMETIDTKKLTQAASELVNETIKENRKPEWKVKQTLIQDFTDEAGNKYTLKVTVQPFDSRPQDISK